MKTKVKFKNSKVGVYILLSVLSLLLIAAIFVGAGGKTKTVYIPVPGNASSDFSGVMLSDYDSLRLYMCNNSVILDFDDVELEDYDFVVLDIVNASLLPFDMNSTSFGPTIEGVNLNTYGSFNYDTYNVDYSGVYPDMEGTFTYVFDMRGESIKVYTYQDGVFNKVITSDISKGILKDFTFIAEINYGLQSIHSVYLYAYEDAGDCTLGNYISDSSLNLTTCKDSMLYKGD